MRRLFTFFLLIFVCFLGGCSETKDKQTANWVNKQEGVQATNPVIVTPIEKVFPVPYFPERDEQLFGMPLNNFSKEWAFACIYSEETMSSDQISFINSLSSMQDDGIWGTSFERDFDGDNYDERVNYGAYQNRSGKIGNFLIVTKKKENGIGVVLLHGFPEAGGRFACFYMKSKDHSLLFGSGLIAGEVNWELSWTKDGPLITDLALED